MRVAVRPAAHSDLVALTTIYNHWIEASHATLDDQPLDEGEGRAWLARFAPSGPHRLLVAHADDVVLGCASSSRHRDHPAFRHTVETGIFLAPDACGRGIGTLLYRTLLSLLEREELHRALAAIALPNAASVALHEACGFRRIGVFHECATKRGLRVSSLWMERALDGAF